MGKQGLSKGIRYHKMYTMLKNPEKSVILEDFSIGAVTNWPAE